jgi:DNA-binding LacI/PurR family transcriptional regulator
VAKRPTIIDVAKLAGVSKATVGRVVSGQSDIVSENTRLRVMEAVVQLGYERNAVAGSLRTDRTFMVALSIPDITNPFWPAVARGVQDTLELHGYTVVTVNTDWDMARESKYLKMVRSNRLDGLVINPTDSSGTDFREMNIPIVILGSDSGYPEYDAVGSNTEKGVRDALSCLYEIGHRRIGLIAGLSMRRKLTTRYHSYLDFIARNHLRLDEKLVVFCDFSIQAGGEAMQQLMALEEPPTAIFAANDILAIGALQKAHALGYRIPDDLSIVGMDDIYAATTTSPPLTTVAKPKYEIGVQAANFLLSRMDDQADLPPQKAQLPCELIIRASTAPPRQH